MHAHVKFQTFGFNLQKIGGIQNEHLIVVCYSDLVFVFMVPYRPTVLPRLVRLPVWYDPLIQE